MKWRLIQLCGFHPHLFLLRLNFPAHLYESSLSHHSLPPWPTAKCPVSSSHSPTLSLSLLTFNPQCDKEIEQVQSQLDDYKDPPLSLSRLSLKQQKFKTFRETANVSGGRVDQFHVNCLSFMGFCTWKRRLLFWSQNVFQSTWLTLNSVSHRVKAAVCIMWVTEFLTLAPPTGRIRNDTVVNAVKVAQTVSVLTIFFFYRCRKII